MNMTDPIADMLTRIRNAVAARHNRVSIPACVDANEACQQTGATSIYKTG